MATENKRMFQLYDVAINWTNNNPVLGSGELGFDKSNLELKIGDGVTTWNNLGILAKTGAGLDFLSDVIITNPQPGDVLVWNGTEWVNGDVPQATETKIGGAKIATQTQVDARTDDTTIITPYKLGQTTGLYAGPGISFNPGTARYGVDLAPESGLGFSGSGDTAQLKVDILSLPYIAIPSSADNLMVQQQTGDLRRLTRGDFLAGITGSMIFRGTWNATTNIVTGDPLNASLVASTAPNAPIGIDPSGYTYIVDTAGLFDLGTGLVNYSVGDYVIWSGTEWTHVASNVPVTSVFGRIGSVIAQGGDYDAIQVDFTPFGNIAATNVQNAIVELESEKVTATRSISTGNGLTGGGDFSINRIHSVVAGQNVNVTAGGVNVSNSSEVVRGAIEIADVGELAAGSDDTRAITPYKLQLKLGTINVIGDVDTATVIPINGQALVWNGSNWIPGTVAGLVNVINYLNDVDTVTVPPANGNALIWNATSLNWMPGTIAQYIDDLLDVDTVSSPPTFGQTLRWNNANWVPSTVISPPATESIAGVAEIATQAETNAGFDDGRIVSPLKLNVWLSGKSINDLSDVNTVAPPPNINDALIWNGGSWVPGATTVPAASETVAGIIRISTQAEAIAGTNNNTSITPLKFRQAFAVMSINALVDVDTATALPSTNDVLSWNGANWIPVTLAPVLPPAASETVSGIAELATQAEVSTGTDDLRIVTPLKLANRVASTTQTGLIEIATQPETDAGTDDAQEITPLKLTQRAATQTLSGVIAIATQVETDTGANDSKAITPAKLTSFIGSRSINVLVDVDTVTVPPVGGNVLQWNGANWIPAQTTIAAATETVLGTIMLCTTVEAQTGTNDTDAVTPLKFRQAFGVMSINALVDVDTFTVAPAINQALIWNNTNWVPGNVAVSAASETVAGIAEIATQAEITAGTIDTDIVSPLKLNTWIGTVVIDRLSDVVITAPAANQVLQFDGLNWINATAAGAPPASEIQQGVAELATQAETNTGADDLRIVTPLKLNTWINTQSIDELSDVIITAPATNQVLQYDGANWINTTAAGVADATETVRGIVEIATQVEVDAGAVDAPVAVTPLKLASRVAALPGQGLVAVGTRLDVELVAANSGLQLVGAAPAGQLGVDIVGTTVITDVQDADELFIYDVTAAGLRKVTKASLLGGLSTGLIFRGTWNAATNVVSGDALNLLLTKNVAPAAPAGDDPTGYYYSVTTQGDFDLDAAAGAETWFVGDMATWSTTQWVRIPGSSVLSVFGRGGVVVSANGDYTAGQVTNVATAPIVAITVQAAIDELAIIKVSGTTTVTAGAGLAGGGPLSGNITLDAVALAGTGIQVNADSIQGISSTEAIVGVHRFATQVETTTGTLDTVGITPLKLQQKLATIPLDALSDVVITTVATGNLLSYDGANWINVTVATAIPAATELVAGIAELATQAEVNAGTDDLRIITPLKLETWIHTQVLDDLSDVVIAAIANTHILQYNGANWVNVLPSTIVAAASETVAGIAELATQAEVTTGTDDLRIVTPLKLQTRLAAQVLNDLFDVIITTAAANQFLYYTGTQWVNGNVQATELIQGTAEIATQAETTAGTSDVVVLTPLKLQQRLVSLGATGYMVIKNVTTPYTLLDTDTNQFLVFNNVANIALTIPNGLTLGHHFAVTNIGGGNVVITMGTDTLRGTNTLGNILGFMTVTKITATVWQSSER